MKITIENILEPDEPEIIIRCIITMKLNKYLSCFFKNFLLACEFLMVLSIMFFSIYSIKTINASLLWQIVLAAATYTFYKFALVNKLELVKSIK